MANDGSFVICFGVERVEGMGMNLRRNHPPVLPEKRHDLCHLLWGNHKAVSARRLLWPIRTGHPYVLALTVPEPENNTFDADGAGLAEIPQCLFCKRIRTEQHLLTSLQPAVPDSSQQSTYVIPVVAAVADHFAEENNDHQQTPEEILAAALSQMPDEKLTSFALRLALTGYVTIPRENDLDYLAEAEGVFVPPPPAKRKPKPNKPTLIKASTKAAPTKAATSKKKVAA
jgi:hypothetical protein